LPWMMTMAPCELGFEPGEIVIIFGFRPGGGRPYIRGKAEIISATWQRDYYRVKFFGEPISRVEFVHPDYQIGDPERHLRLLTELWHTSQFPDLENFFPDLSV